MALQDTQEVAPAVGVLPMAGTGVASSSTDDAAQAAAKAAADTKKRKAIEMFGADVDAEPEV